MKNKNTSAFKETSFHNLVLSERKNSVPDDSSCHYLLKYSAFPERNTQTTTS